MSKKKHYISDVCIADLNFNKSKNNINIFIENFDNIPFKVKRFMSVINFEKQVKGNHCNTNSNILIQVVKGELVLNVDDGENNKKIILNDKGIKSVLIPKGIWTKLFYKNMETILIIFADKSFEKTKYIDNYSKFIKFRKR